MSIMSAAGSWVRKSDLSKPSISNASASQSLTSRAIRGLVLKITKACAARSTCRNEREN